MAAEVQLSQYCIVHFARQIYEVPQGSSSTESILLPYHWNINVPAHMYQSYHEFLSSWFIC